MSTQRRFINQSGRLATTLSTVVLAMALGACGGGSQGDEVSHVPARLESLVQPTKAVVETSRCAPLTSHFTVVNGRCLAAEAGPLKTVMQKVPRAAQAAPLSISADQFMNWAETTFAGYFPDHQATIVRDGFVFRYYPKGNSFIGVTNDGGVYVLFLNLDSQVKYIAPLADFTCLVTPAAASCGPVTGGTFGTGNFVVTVANNSIPPSANAAPVATALGAIPSDVKVSSYETNVTSGAKAYTLKTGSTGFNTATVGNVRLEVPFDRNLVPDKTKLDSLHLLLRILNTDDKSVVNLTGQIVGDKIVADLTGFPASATVTVLFNPNMDVAVNDAPGQSGFQSDAKLAAPTSPTWTTRKWAVVYDAVEVAAEVKTFLGSSAAPSTEQIRLVVKQQIANHAADAAAIYQGEGFRSPTLYVAKTAAEVGGAGYGTNPRYLLHYQAAQSAKFSPEDPNEVVGSDANHYGRVYIQTSNLNDKYASMGMSIYGTIAHELFHAVQAGYGLAGKTALKGVREGSATAYGDLLDRRHNETPSAIPQVRQGSHFPTQTKEETFKLDAYLLVEQTAGSLAYSNQDFFVYIARMIGNNNFKYLATLFEQLRLTLEDEANKQPTPAAIANALNTPLRATVLKGFDNFFSGNYGIGLVSAFENFGQQRVMEHNTASQFGRPGETTNGLAVNLFNNFPPAVTFKELLVDPSSGATTVVNDLFPLSTLSSRVLRIRPVAGKSGGAITISVQLSTGTFGTTVSGWIYRTASAATARTSTPLQPINSVAEFGANSADEVTIVLINPSFAISAVGVAFEIKGTAPDINISPTVATVSPGATRLFTTNAAATSVSWSVQEGAAGGTVTSAGLYTAPSQAGTYHVVVTSKVDPAKNASAVVTVSSLGGNLPVLQRMKHAKLHFEGKWTTNNWLAGVETTKVSFFDLSAPGYPDYLSTLEIAWNGTSFSGTQTNVATGVKGQLRGTVSEDGRMLTSIEWTYSRDETYTYSNAETRLAMKFQNVPIPQLVFASVTNDKFEVRPYGSSVQQYFSEISFHYISYRAGARESESTMVPGSVQWDATGLQSTPYLYVGFGP